MTKLALALAAATVLAVPALAQAGAPIRVTLAAPAANSTVKAIATTWTCAGASCTGPAINGRFGDARGCREIAKAAGAVASYEGEKGPLGADDLAKCNKSAKKAG